MLACWPVLYLQAKYPQRVGYLSARSGGLLLQMHGPDGTRSFARGS